MVDPSYRTEGEREEIYEEIIADIESTETASLPLSDSGFSTRCRLASHG